ncbi:MAG: hypothetical protein SVV80_14670 [Planctomycetota bacterium]|nr:hypothetical protein [Planctomycetota bacterium]
MRRTRRIRFRERYGGQDQAKDVHAFTLAPLRLRRPGFLVDGTRESRRDPRAVQAGGLRKSL